MPDPRLIPQERFLPFVRRYLRKLRRIIADRCSHFIFLLRNNRKKDALFFFVGPYGIFKVLNMTYKLLSTYVFILLPMLMREFSNSHFRWLVLLFHISIESYLLIQIFFNLYCCITEKHSGPHHDMLVREIASVTNFEYPNTPDALAEHQRHVDERMEDFPEDKKGNKPPMWLSLEPLEWGYCKRTNTPRPPRCHYNQIIRKPVLNFDHYCPWIWNAVGYFNYRHFLTFVFSVFLMMIYKGLLLIGPFYRLGTDAYRKQYELQNTARQRGEVFTRLPGMIPLPSERKYIRQAFRLSRGLGCAMILLGGLHIYLTSTGQTTLEWKSRIACLFCQKNYNNRDPITPYSFDRIADNWKRVFGRNWVRSLLIPNRRLPEYLPFPVPGQSGLRPSIKTLNDRSYKIHNL